MIGTIMMEWLENREKNTKREEEKVEENSKHIQNLLNFKRSKFKKYSKDMENGKKLKFSNVKIYEKIIMKESDSVEFNYSDKIHQNQHVLTVL